MNPAELHRWQWSDYSANHASQANLWIHIVAVPLFLIGNILALALPAFAGYAIEVYRQVGWGDGTGRSLALPFLMVLPGLLLSAVAMALQGMGHGKEAIRPKPFTGAWNAIARIFTEQWVTFPRFVFSGGWLRALRAARSNRP